MQLILLHPPNSVPSIAALTPWYCMSMERHQLFACPGSLFTLQLRQYWCWRQTHSFAHQQVHCKFKQNSLNLSNELLVCEKTNTQSAPSKLRYPHLPHSTIFAATHSFATRAPLINPIRTLKPSTINSNHDNPRKQSKNLEERMLCSGRAGCEWGRNEEREARGGRLSEMAAQWKLHPPPWGR